MPAKPKTADRRDIELRAYLIWESEGRPHGREAEHWHRAEAEIFGVKKKAPAKKKAAAKPVLKAVEKPVETPAEKPAAKKAAAKRKTKKKS
jgi:hypothetical protein